MNDTVTPERLKIPAAINRLDTVLDFVRTSANRAGFSPRRITDLVLAVEEAVGNICRYAYPGGNGEIVIFCGNDSEGAFSIEIADGGVPFDLLSVEKPVFEGSLSRRKTGGLGIYLIRHMVDEIRYRREGQRNIITLVMCDRAERKGRSPDPRSGSGGKHPCDAHNPSGAGL